MLNQSVVGSPKGSPGGEPLASKPCVPFLKWAGGKRWLTASHPHIFPPEFDRYVEPFLGSAAVFFHLQPASALLSDSNVDLINVYQEIQRNWAKVQKALHRHHARHTSKYYYIERSRSRRAAHELAAQFLYLNRTCWNGLYRVNLKGEFNVPKGTKSSVILDTDNFEQVSRVLKNADLRASDFEPIINSTNENDFVFIDPPYVTRHNLNGFLKYNEKIFTWSDQVRLAKAIERASKRGAKILLTNANHSSVRLLYRDLAARHTMLSLSRSSVLAADAAQRGAVTELVLAINYRPTR